MLIIGCNIAGGTINISIGSDPVQQTSSGPHRGAVTRIIKDVYDTVVKKFGNPIDQGTLTVDIDAGHGVWQHIAQKLGLKYESNRLHEEGGVGVIANARQAKDPRYCMSLTNDVRPGETDRNLKKLGLK